MKCGHCEGKGWLSERVEPPALELEPQAVHKILAQNSGGLNIDDIARLAGLDIPNLYRTLQILRDKGTIAATKGSPIVYYLLKPEV